MRVDLTLGHAKGHWGRPSTSEATLAYCSPFSYQATVGCRCRVPLLPSLVLAASATPAAIAFASVPFSPASFHPSAGETCHARDLDALVPKLPGVVHPGPLQRWRRQRCRPTPTGPCALQDIAPAEPAAAEEVAPLFPWAASAPEGLLLSLGHSVPSDLPAALQDLALSQHLAVSALLQHIRGEPLQDFIGAQLERVYQCGRQRWGVPEARGPP